jgi:hypothetical protein
MLFGLKLTGIVIAVLGWVLLLFVSIGRINAVDLVD